jgi:hypothetical protein
VLAGDSPQTLIFSLQVTDNEGQVSTNLSTVTITVNAVSAAPTANAGSDQEVDEQTTVTLDGRASDDSDGSIPADGYAWTQTSGPSVGALANTAQPTFTAPTVLAGDSPQTLIFSLQVTDNEGQVSTNLSTVTITVNAGCGWSLHRQRGRNDQPGWLRVV